MTNDYNCKHVQNIEKFELISQVFRQLDRTVHFFSLSPSLILNMWHVVDGEKKYLTND